LPRFAISVIPRRGPARPLTFAGAALLFEALLTRGAGRAGRAAAGRLGEAGGDLLRQAAQGQLAVAGLAAGVLGDGGYM